MSPNGIYNIEEWELDTELCAGDLVVHNNHTETSFDNIHHCYPIY